MKLHVNLMSSNKTWFWDKYSVMLNHNAKNIYWKIKHHDHHLKMNFHLWKYGNELHHGPPLKPRGEPTRAPSKNQKKSDSRHSLLQKKLCSFSFTSFLYTNVNFRKSNPLFPLPNKNSSNLLFFLFGLLLSPQTEIPTLPFKKTLKWPPSCSLSLLFVPPESQLFYFFFVSNSGAQPLSSFSALFPLFSSPVLL